ncbi:hypothetical protein DL96DRAFT_613963 [Flagelloscypha sp. PMI_526]|nr:hypothetical protein DL96DRAFT_613963 [Flagelloscypha sp. PMI_526]
MVDLRYGFCSISLSTVPCGRTECATLEDLPINNPIQQIPESFNTPTCTNCGTQAATIWRRDEGGSIKYSECSPHQRSDGDTNLFRRLVPPTPQSDDIPTCAHCGTQLTPEWKKDMDGKILCNGCQPYVRARKKAPPLVLIAPSRPESHNMIDCFNCGSRHTPGWRISTVGNFFCNACGMYARSNGQPPPALQPRESRRRRGNPIHAETNQG